ncbi:hypothetical protein LY78DRAFT_664697 [Colletotrichum sublineola]|uniref:Uncharacterized protein n=1 Tax=Colletotrichum sublineola TaxID=1173701 RepID=A0A066WT64_COLSU|nr:hypothetical protein LY78DRAFT_664697 [Colletotrichum sublineola]KDN59842.1 hypothetical protein CSUB01_12394 [Colletotrichum sublineola]
MTTLVDTFVPSSIYNTLPLISQVAGAPTDHSQDLQDLRELLNKHNVPKGVSVRLIHKHFDTTEGEVMVFDKISVPEHGVVQIMRPIVPPSDNQLRGIHYFVNNNASLQAYEYGNYDIPDMSGLQSFLAEFCSLVSKRGLQRKFGLKLQREDNADQNGWTEYELHSKRGTIMFPDGMPMPDGESDYSVTTEWKAIFNEVPRTCKHSTTCRHGRTTCKHCKHCSSHPDESIANSGNETGFCLGRQKILPGTPVHDIVDRIIAAF